MKIDTEKYILDYIKHNPGASVLSAELNDLFQRCEGIKNPLTFQNRLSRYLAKLYKEGKINRKKVAPGINGEGHVKWVYAYDLFLDE
jgi:hypothetical protein